MMSGKAILEFDLADPDQREAHEKAIKASSFSLALWEIHSKIFRDRLKYRSDQYSEKELRLIQEMRDEFSEILSDNGVSDAIG